MGRRVLGPNPPRTGALRFPGLAPGAARFAGGRAWGPGVIRLAGAAHAAVRAGLMRMGPFPAMRFTRGPVPSNMYLSNVRRPIFTILWGSEIRFGVSCGQLGRDVVLVGESAKDLLPADPVVGEVDRFGWTGACLS
jgi:hypothetical protein